MVFGRGYTTAVEHFFDTGLKLLFPPVDQGRVDAELLGQFVDRLITLERRQGHLGLERRGMGFPLPGHTFPFYWTIGHTNSSLFDCPVFGVHYKVASSVVLPEML